MSLINIETPRGTILASDVGGMLVMGYEAPSIDKTLHPDQQPLNISEIPTKQIQDVGYIAAASQS